MSLPMDTLEGVTRADEVFPYFIKHELPAPVAGLVIAAILAAAMSTVDSSLNSMSTVILVDVFRRFRRADSPRIPEIITLRAATITLGLLGHVYRGRTLQPLSGSGPHDHGPVVAVRGNRRRGDVRTVRAGVDYAAGPGVGRRPRRAGDDTRAGVGNVPSRPCRTTTRSRRTSVRCTPISWGVSGTVTLVAVAALVLLGVHAGLFRPNPRADQLPDV